MFDLICKIYELLKYWEGLSKSTLKLFAYEIWMNILQEFIEEPAVLKILVIVIILF